MQTILPTISTEAKEIIKQKYGFRCDDISELDYQGQISGLDTLTHEIIDLDNYDILRELNDFYHLNLVTSEDDIPSSVPEEDYPAFIQKQVKKADHFFKDKFNKPYSIIWLCAIPHDVIESYIVTDDAEQVIGDYTISQYKLPNSAMLISDLGEEGCAFAMPTDEIEVI